MGTRNLTCVYSDGEYKVAQYGQWDGFPEGQGATAYKFASSADLEQFKKKLQNIRFLTAEEEKKIAYTYAGNEEGWMTSEQSEVFKRDYPQLSRDICADILELINDCEIDVLSNSIDFAGDSLFCEWAYVIDLDKNTFEVFRGFNQSPLKDGERFKFIQDDPEWEPTDNQKLYYPIRHLVTFKLDEFTPSREIFVNIVKEVVAGK